MMRSTRFQMRVVLTEHAKARMVERDLSPALILDIIDNGNQKEAGGPLYGSTSISRIVRTTCSV